VTLRRLVLWRHGQTDDNAAGRIQGHVDSLLSSIGQEQARRVAPIIAGFQPDVAVTSDLRRAADTIAAFTALTGIPAAQDKRLREMFMGDWQGCTWAEAQRRWPSLVARWRTDPHQEPPGGESQLQVATRAYEAVQELDLAHDGTALLCCHGGVIRLLTALMLGLPPASWPAISVVGNCNWVVLIRQGIGDDRWRLDTYNGGPSE
jgi:glucosyl-3-phosphoglycerate phosphatase